MGGGRRRRHELVARRGRRRRIARLAGVAVLIAAVAAGAVVAVRSRRDDGDGATTLVLRRSGSVVIERAAESPLPPANSPNAYRIDYRVTFRSGASNVERLAVRRPFDSRLETFFRPQADGPPDRVRESRFGVIATRAGTDPARVVATSPNVAAGDVRVAGLAAAVEAGVAERRERRRVAGRECDVYRAGGSVIDGPLRRPTPRDHTDVCVDAAGLLLEGWVVTDGKPLVHRLATAVTDAPSRVGDMTLTLPDAPTDPAGGDGSIGQVQAGTAPVGPAFAVDTAPAGFAFKGRFAVVPGQLALADPTREGQAVAGLTDVWTRGSEIVAVEQGGRLDQSDPFSYDEKSPKVDLAPLASEGELRFSLSGAELRVLLGEGRFVRVYGTVPPDSLVVIARGLRPVQGTGLGTL